MIEGLEDVIKADSARSTKVDCTASVEEYINNTDWRIKANANTGYSSAGLVNNLAGKVIANYWLDKVYSKKEGDAHRNGDYHIHDLDILGAYCCGHDLQRLLKEGFNGVAGRVGSRAPKHLREALGQMANFIGILQSEWAGAQAFSSFDTYLAPILFFDKYYLGITDDEVEKAICGFVYNLNVPSRWGQSPFSNVTIDLKCPNDLKSQLPMRNRMVGSETVEEPFFISVSNEVDKNSEGWKRVVEELRNRVEGGHDMDEESVLYSATYSLFDKEIKTMFQCYYKVMSHGDAFGVPFTFPIPTLNITEDFDWDNKDYDVVWDNTAKYGSSYFQNFIGSQYLRDENGQLTIKDENAYSPNDVRSMAFLPSQKFNCRVEGVETTLTIAEMYKNVWHSMEKPMKLEVLSHKHEYATISEMFKIPYASYGNKAVAITLCGRETEAPFVVSVDHKCAIVGDDGEYVNKLAQDVLVGDLIPVREGDEVKGVAVTSVRVVDVPLDYVYNFTIDTPEHLVELPNGIISPQCCRLQLDKKAIRKRGGGLFGSDAQTGSIGVVTINMARLGYLYKGKSIKQLINRLYHLMDLAKSTLEKKRAVVKELNARGMYPYTSRYIRTFDTFFSTIGINGMNECIRNFSDDKNDITDEMGQAMAIQIMDLIKRRLNQYQEETGNLYNLEATPGEGTCYRFAREDAKRYPDIIQAGVPEAPYYTNSSQLPAAFGSNVFDALDLQDELQRMYTGGTVLHIYSQEDVTADHVKNLIRKVLSNYRLPYVSYTASFSTCPKHGRIPGMHKFCPKCDEELLKKYSEEV